MRLIGLTAGTAPSTFAASGWQLTLRRTLHAYPFRPPRRREVVADDAYSHQPHLSEDMTNVHEAEKKFEKYRDNLRREVGLLADYVRLFRGLHESRTSYPFEVNSAPASSL